MRTTAFVVLVSLVLLVGPGCAKTHADQGRDATLIVKDGQFVREDLPSPANGPKVVSASTDGVAYAGRVDQGLSGELEKPSTAVAIALAGDIGYWILPAQLPPLESPSTPTFLASFAIAKTAQPGPRQVIFRAVDGDGRFGPPLSRPLAIVGQTTPVGRLVISLTWSNHADLDLHVVLPNGVELFKRNRTEYQHPPFGAGVAPSDAPLDGGVLDRDSNAQCLADGANAENAVWAEPPPAGPYVVRVDTFSLCGEPSAPWRLEVLRDGILFHSTEGVATDSDRRFDHGRGAGVLALEFSL